MNLVVADIGGTHARFAIAAVNAGKATTLGEPVTLKTSDYVNLWAAWQAFAQTQGGELPRAASIAIASPIDGDVIKLTNNSWSIRPALIRERLNVDRWTLVNDFGAIGHAVARLPDSEFMHLCGPSESLPANGMISICGPGTGLGVAAVHRHARGYDVIETEGGHQDFAPLDEIDDALLRRLQIDHGRVSIERIVAGPGIVAIYETLAAIEGRAVPARSDREIWTLALDGADTLASAALHRFCQSLGAFAGDLALAQGAKGVVIAGGLGLRLRDHLVPAGFARRFVAKGRFAKLLDALPVKIITHPQPGLFGAAAAFLHQHG